MARKSCAYSEQCGGTLGSVSSVAILNMAAVGSNSYQGGRHLSISTTVAPILLSKGNTDHAEASQRQHTVVPDVSFFSIWFSLDDFWGHPVRSALHRLDSSSPASNSLRERKPCELVRSCDFPRSHMIWAQSCAPLVCWHIIHTWSLFDAPKSANFTLP